jgi:hypothetical protein
MLFSYFCQHCKRIFVDFIYKIYILIKLSKMGTDIICPTTPVEENVGDLTEILILSSNGCLWC